MPPCEAFVSKSVSSAPAQPMVDATQARSLAETARLLCQLLVMSPTNRVCTRRHWWALGAHLTRSVDLSYLLVRPFVCSRKRRWDSEALTSALPRRTRTALPRATHRVPFSGRDSGTDLRADRRAIGGFLMRDHRPGSLRSPDDPGLGPGAFRQFCARLSLGTTPAPRVPSGHGVRIGVTHRASAGHFKRRGVPVGPAKHS
jgi:hypothetical protein